MEFLLKSQKRNRRRLIIEQLILLALRCLLVAMVTLLVARFAGFVFAMGQGKDTLHIAVLDDTLSMTDQWREGEGLRDCFQVAKNDFLLERIVKVHSNPGERVLDFFAGSGTAGEAAARHGREFVMVDENSEAVRVMEQRLAKWL